MTTEQKDLVKATVPVLKEHGVALTTYFYNRMLTNNPELKHIFNSANQANGAQPTALAMSVLAYAEHIDNPAVLVHAVNKIANKHVSLDIRPEQYQIVGKHLLASIQEVLGDAATPELVDAWAVAYGQLANIMIETEAGIYTSVVAKDGGWTGWRPFIVKKKVKESEEITSFYLHPSDGGRVADFIPGQYTGVRVFVPELHVYQPRQYSISCAPNGEYYRISVKRESGSDLKPQGMVSNHLHKYINEGDMIPLAPPAGDFTYDVNLSNPVVFISGGVGVTPFISMLEAQVASGNKRSITWIHGCRDLSVHAFRELVQGIADEHDDFAVHHFFDMLDKDNCGANAYEGYVDLGKVMEAMVPDAMYYLCGPTGFIKLHYEFLRSKGVKQDAIYFEEFGPGVLVVE